MKLKMTSTALSTTLGATAMLLFLGVSQAASAQAGGGLQNNKVVRDSSGHVVRSIAHGTCVRTEWEAGMNPCGSEQVQLSQVRTILSTDDRTVYFPFDSAVLTEDAKRRLDLVAERLRGADDVKDADIVGFADRIGTSSYNDDLSRRRAEAVKNYLAQRGYLNTNIADVRGLGETQSVTTCDQSLPRNQEIACLSADRRVEVEVQYLDSYRVSDAAYPQAGYR